MAQFPSVKIFVFTKNGVLLHWKEADK